MAEGLSFVGELFIQLDVGSLRHVEAGPGSGTGSASPASPPGPRARQAQEYAGTGRLPNPSPQQLPFCFAEVGPVPSTNGDPLPGFAPGSSY